MNCREACEKLAELSADTLSLAEAHEIQQHLEKCPPCLEEWHLFHITVFSLSTTQQPLLPQEKSREIWHVCLCHIEEKTAHSFPSHTQISQKKSSAPAFKSSFEYSEEQTPKNWDEHVKAADSATTIAVTPQILKNRTSWLHAPWIGWTSLVTSFAIFGAVWVSTPPQTHQDLASPSIRQQNDVFSNGTPTSQAEWVRFQTPPAIAKPYINHHALMSFDPFSDRVGTTLVADTAAEAVSMSFSLSPVEAAQFNAAQSDVMDSDTTQ